MNEAVSRAFERVANQFMTRIVTRRGEWICELCGGETVPNGPVVHTPECALTVLHLALTAPQPAPSLERFEVEGMKAAVNRGAGTHNPYIFTDAVEARDAWWKGFSFVKAELDFEFQRGLQADRNPLDLGFMPKLAQPHVAPAEFVEESSTYSPQPAPAEVIPDISIDEFVERNRGNWEGVDAVEYVRAMRGGDTEPQPAPEQFPIGTTLVSGYIPVVVAPEPGTREWELTMLIRGMQAALDPAGENDERYQNELDRIFSVNPALQPQPAPDAPTEPAEAVIDSVRQLLIWYKGENLNYGSLRKWPVGRGGVPTEGWPEWAFTEPDEVHVTKAAFAILLWHTFKAAERRTVLAESKPVPDALREISTILDHLCDIQDALPDNSEIWEPLEGAMSDLLSAKHLFEARAALAQAEQ